MAEARNSKDATEKLLARGLRGSLDASSEDCPDAGILAAYFDRELPADESARWELHFSVCARCQEQLADLARTETAAPPSISRAPLRFWDWRWMAPLATAAAAVALWVVMRPAPPGQQPGTIYQETPAVARPGGQPAPAEPKSELAGKLAQALPAKPAEKRAAGGKATAPVAASAEGARSEVSVPRAEADALAKQAVGRVAEATPLAGALAQARKQGRAADEAQVEKLEERQRSAQNVSQAQKVAAPQAPAAQDQLEKRAQQVVTVENAPAAAARDTKAARADEPAKQRAAQETSVYRNREAPLRMMPSAPSELRFAAPGAKLAWRYAEGKVQRSTDSGWTWADLFKPARPVTAGVCPSEKVCWLVGESGLVLRATDGEKWETATPPTLAKLVAVTATDASSARVTAVDGKRFSTTDGGKTWKQEGIYAP